MTSPTAPSEPVVWEGTPSPGADLPTYVALALGAVLATGGLLFLGRAGDTSAGGRSLGPLVPWLIALVWVICASGALGTYLRSRSVRYTLTRERLRVTTGLLSTTTQELELRRVRDTVVVQPFALRLLGLGHVTLVSADASTPRTALRAVSDPAALQSTIRTLVQEAYASGRVREIDVL
jgi:putative membrane protein